MRIDQAIKTAAASLAPPTAGPAWLDAEVILAHILGVGREYLAAHGEAALTTRQTQRFARLLKRRRRGVPTAYLCGCKEFYGRNFTVNRDVVVPRPETEALIAIVLRDPGASSATIADIGSGCGNLGITLALELPHATIHAVERSRRAVAVTQANAKRLGASIQVHCGNLLQPLAEVPLEVIVANLPYLDDRIYRRNSALRHEPCHALWSSDCGLAHYRQLLGQIAERKKPPRLVVCEINGPQLPRFGRIAQAVLPYFHLDATLVFGVAIVSLTLRSPVSGYDHHGTLKDSKSMIRRDHVKTHGLRLAQGALEGRERGFAMSSTEYPCIGTARIDFPTLPHSLEWYRI